MARFVYLVLSHADVPLLERLVGLIRRTSPESLVLVHHDASKTPLPRDFCAGDARVVRLAPSLAGGWGSFALVEMVQLGLRHLRDAAVDYDYLTLLSGADYPIRPLREFEAALVASHDGMMGLEDTPPGILDRYAFAWYRLPRWMENGVTHRIVGRLGGLNRKQPYLRFQSGRVGCRIGVRPRTSPLDALRIYKGPQWWALSSRAIATIETFIAERPAYVDWFRRHTLIPDEAFFHTIVFNAGGLDVSRDAGRYIRWTQPGSGSPDRLDLPDLPALRASGKYFARKFAADSSAILDALDELTTNTPHYARPSTSSG
jgi:hypothetical protein